jgi:lipoprotein-anchoring transpeptidase ErfK/SrfK
VARRIATGITVGALLLVGGCGGEQPTWYGANGQPAAEAPPPPPVNITVTAPADGAADVAPATEIAYTTDAASTTVELTDATGAAIPGALRSDKSTWVPGQMLKWATQYTAKITGADASGRTESRTVTFTTMAKPAATAKASSIIGDGQVVGVGMPIILSFSNDIAKDQRANVQKRLFVTSDPPQEGIWYWWNDKEVHYRTKEYWQSGTKITVRAAIGGLSLGGNRYGSADLTINATVGPKIVMVADNANKQMSVTKDGVLLRNIPVSFGKKSTPTDSGNLIVMIKNRSEIFDSSTTGLPNSAPGGYRMTVYWTQRLTWSGEYLHAAPWSEGQQGRVNVSHGCTNLSTANAQWLYGITHIGDPVIIKGTEAHVKWQNGWTDWERSWDEYVKGSAIPYTPPVAEPSAGPSAGPSASPSTSN